MNGLINNIQQIISLIQIQFNKIMKSLTTYITEKMIYNKDTASKSKSKYNYHPKYAFELTELMEKLVKERGQNGDFNDIDVSQITDMDYVFKDKFPLFNGDISKWDVSNVTTMESMFEECHSFEGKGLNKWDISKCKNFKSTFKSCGSLNTDNIEKWGKKLIPYAYIRGMFLNNNSAPNWYKR